MANTIRSTTAVAVAKEGLNPIRNVGGANQAATPGSDSLPEVGPAYEVEISSDGQTFSRQEDSPEKQAALVEKQTQLSQESIKGKKQQTWRIQSEVARLRRTEQNIRAHEAAHMAAGGAFAGGVSYIYAKGPDGKMYISGGEVPIQVPEGKTPEETARNMEIVKRAALAPADPSGQDLAVAAAAMQIESRARAAIRQGRFLKQSDMEENGAGVLNQPPVWPTSMAGLITTLMPAEGMTGRRMFAGQ